MRPTSPSETLDPIKDWSVEKSSQRPSRATTAPTSTPTPIGRPVPDLAVPAPSQQQRGKKPRVRRRSTRKRLDVRRLVEGRILGMPLADAAAYAGSKATNRHAAASVAFKVLGTPEAEALELKLAEVWGEDAQAAWRAGIARIRRWCEGREPGATRLDVANGMGIVGRSLGRFVDRVEVAPAHAIPYRSCLPGEAVVACEDDGRGVEPPGAPALPATSTAPSSATPEKGKETS